MRIFYRFVSSLSFVQLSAQFDIQCCIPVFDGLLPEPHNSAILSLLFTFSHWHGLAKLRMHTDPSIALLESETERLFEQLRHFADDVCPSFDTYELKREVDARQRAKQRRDAKKATGASQATSKGKGKATNLKGKGKATSLFPSAGTENAGPQKKQYHLVTIKHHSLPDYPKTIREFGTTDSYSSQPVSYPSWS